MNGTRNIQIMRYAIQALLLVPVLLVLSTVFITNQELAYGVISGKYFWFYVAMGLTSVMVLLSVITHKRNLHFSFLDILIAVFCGCGLSLTYYHTGEITTKWILLLLLLILYFYFRILFTQNKNNLPVLMLFLVLTGLVEAIWGLCQLYGFSSSQHSLFKTTGSFFNPGPYAGYLAVIFPLALYYATTPKSPKGDLECKIVHCAAPKSPLGDLGVVRVIGIVTCITILLVLPATMSRASWLAATTGSLVVIIPYFAKRLEIFRNRRLKTGLISIVVILLVISVALVGIYHLKKDSADGRALMWKITLQAISKHPFGVGLGNFPGTYASEQALYFASGRATEAEESVAGSPEYGFNEYLQICLEWGVIPFVLFLSIIAGSLYTAYRRKQWGILAPFVSLLVFALMSYPFSILPFLIVFVFLLTPQPPKGGVGVQNCALCCTKVPFRGYRGIIVCFVVTAFCLYNRYPSYEAYKKWNLAQMQYQAKDYTAAKIEYEQLYPQLNDQIHFLFEYGHSLSCTGDYEKSNQILHKVSRISGDPMIYNIMGKNHQALKEYEQAEACFVHAAHIIPHRLYPWYLLCKLYAEMNLFDKVKETADIVQTKEPKVQSTAVREMRKDVETWRATSKN